MRHLGIYFQTKDGVCLSSGGDKILISSTQLHIHTLMALHFLRSNLFVMR